MKRFFHTGPNPGFFQRLFGNVLPVVLMVLAGTVLLFMSNDGCGDRPQDFRAAGIALGVGLFITLVLSVVVKDGERTAKAQYGMRLAIRLFLAYTFVSYGAAKLVDMQFASNLIALDSRIIDLTPMQVAWAFFGYTYTYQAIIGGSQIAAAVLLCFRSTTTLGAIVLLTVIGNIVMVNVFYDICVKLNSTIYLAMTLYLLLVDVKRLWAYFIANRPVPPREYPVWARNQTTSRLLAVLRYGLILFVLLYPFYETVQTKEEFGVGARSALYGVWKVDQARLLHTQSDSLAVGPFPTPGTKTVWGGQWEKVFFNSFSFGAAKGPGGLDYFSYELDSARQTVALTFVRDSTLNFTGSYAQPAPDQLRLQGTNAQDSVALTLTVLPEFFRTRR